jgi:hypothetical protein
MDSIRGIRVGVLILLLASAVWAQDIAVRQVNRGDFTVNETGPDACWKLVHNDSVATYLDYHAGITSSQLKIYTTTVLDSIYAYAERNHIRIPNEMREGADAITIDSD